MEHGERLGCRGHRARHCGYVFFIRREEAEPGSRRSSPNLPEITGDEHRLIQVVINLISNAVKFTDAGSITCAARKHGHDLVVSVKDSGIGIALTDQPKVFEKFKQVGDTLTDKPKGTGLGLADLQGNCGVSRRPHLG